MRYLRTVSTRRLLALIAGLVVVIAGGTAIAVAASGNGPEAAARRRWPTRSIDALAAPAVRGVTARISFTNHLIGASSLQGSDPILSGASGRLWLSTDGRLRLELQSDNGDAQVVVSNGRFWVYDPSAHTAYEGKLPGRAPTRTSRAPARTASRRSRQIQKQISQFVQHAQL